MQRWSDDQCRSIFVGQNENVYQINSKHRQNWYTGTIFVSKSKFQSQFAGYLSQCSKLSSSCQIHCASGNIGRFRSKTAKIIVYANVFRHGHTSQIWRNTLSKQFGWCDLACTRIGTLLVCVHPDNCRRSHARNGHSLTYRWITELFKCESARIRTLSTIMGMHHWWAPMKAKLEYGASRVQGWSKNLRFIRREWNPKGSQSKISLF